MHSIPLRPEQNLGYIEDCPVCHKMGVINNDFPPKKDDFDSNIQYVVTHEKTSCNISKQEDRDVILKALGRYIETPVEIK